MTTATEATPRGTKAEQARRRLGELAAELEHINGLILASLSAEDEARIAALREAPMRGTEQVGSTVSKIRTQRSKNETRGEALRREISALERLVGEFEQEAVVQTIGEVSKRAQELVANERAAWTAFADRLTALHITWSDVLLPALEARDDFRVEAEAAHPQLASSEAWASAIEPLVSPVPLDFLAAFEMTFAAVADLLGLGLRQDGGQRSDERRVLTEITPDLRPTDRAAVLSGKTPTRASNTHAGGPEVVRAERADGLTDWHR